MGARALGAGGYQAPVQKSTSSPRIQRRAVLCPDCKAAVGEPCLSSEGKELTACHRSRVRMATRHHLAMRSSS